MKKAQIENGVVVNLILVDPENIPDWCQSWPTVDDSISIGSSYADGIFTPPVVDMAAIRSKLKLSFAQLLIGLVTEGWITRAEGEAWLANVLPAPVAYLISTLPEEQQFIALARATRPSEILRSDPLVEQLALYQGKTPEELDQFFTTYSGV